MSQVGFFDFQERCEQLREMGNPLQRLQQAIAWEQFRPVLKKVRDKQRKNNSGRKPYDEVMMFKVLLLQQLYNLSDDQSEYQIRDRISFMQFLGLDMGDAVPDAKTIWLFRDDLSRLGLAQKLFKRFDRFLSQQGYTAKAGTIVDASIVQVPKQRNSRDENRQIKNGDTPESFEQKPAKGRQKDTDARWVKKAGGSYFGYKNHIGVDNQHKLIRSYQVTAASVHDSECFKELVSQSAPRNRNKDVFGDSAYSSSKIRKLLAKLHLRDRLHCKGYRYKKLGERSQQANYKKSQSRARVEHIFGRQAQFGDRMMRCIGLIRAKNWIGLRNLLYNIDRYVRLAT
jgi:IS5 family transposase